MNLQQLSQELAQRKEEFASLKEKVNQVCQTLLEKVEKDLTPEEEELINMLTDSLTNLPPKTHETDDYRNVENLRLRLENSLQDEYEKIEQKRTALGENINVTIEMIYDTYELMFYMYVNFVEAMEAQRQR
jgi:hypothetical protein